jgi:hypothetical protein
LSIFSKIVGAELRIEPHQISHDLEGAILTSHTRNDGIISRPDAEAATL